MKIPLSQLEPVFVTQAENDSFHEHETLPVESAQGIMFLDPKKFEANGTIGCSMILVWFNNRGVTPDAKPVPRWNVSGTDFYNLTLSPSIDCTSNGKYPDEWHGWVQDGFCT